MVLKRIRNRLRHGRVRLAERFFSILDSEGVVFFQAIVYVHMAAAGAWGLFFARSVPPSIASVVPHRIEQMLLWMYIGMLLCLLGRVLSSGPDRTRYWVYSSGLLLQLCGDISAFGGFAGYVLATVQSSVDQTTETARSAPGVTPMIAAFGFAAYAWCAFFLVWRDVRRWFQAERSVRQ